MTLLSKALVAGIGLGCVLLPDLAVAQQAPWPTYHGNRDYEDSWVTRKPERGYTGWGAFPQRGGYCDYARTPIRRCDQGHCRVVAWNMTQYCY
jgi:hypothetical protein